MAERVELTSVNNDIIKEIVSLSKQRKDNDFMILEGEKSVQAAIEANILLEKIFFEDEKYSKSAKVQYKVNQKIMEKISSTKSPVPVLAVTKAPKATIEEFKKFKKIALFENIKDAGNLGTIIRSAAAFSIDGIVLYGDCVDPFSTKVVRSSAGNIFKTPIIQLKKGLKEFKKSHKFYATVVEGGLPKTTKEPFIVLFGSEAKGLSDEVQNLADEKITIEMSNNVESLNLSVCASIVFYELFKVG